MAGRSKALTVTRTQVLQAAAPRRRSVSRFGRRVTRRRAKTTIPLALIAGFIPAAVDIMNNAKTVGYPKAALHTMAGLIGYDTYGGHYRGWAQAGPAGAGGILAGVAVHIAASKLGVNRMIGRTRIPLLRI